MSTSALAVVDAAVQGRALVVGTPPPAGRDLDVLVRGDDAARLEDALRGAGYVELGGRWARFADCSVDVVDVQTADSWRLPAHEVDALFDAAVSIDGTNRLARPDGAGTVLIEARRWMLGGLLTDKRRARIADAGEVWDEVARRAPAWGVEAALAVVRGETAGAAPAARRWRRRLGRRLGVVVAFSGVDGSGKSSQAESLQTALQRLGYDAVGVWTRITINKSINAVGDPVKRLASDPGRVRAFRQRHPSVNFVWISYVALVNALAVRRATTPHLLRGRVVVCDRYTLDSAAHLKYKYGADRDYRFQVWLIRLLTPRPLRSYFLDVPAPTALARKNEKYTPEQMELLVSLYRDECGELGVRRLDGEARREELCREVALDVATALSTKRQRRGTTRRRIR